MGSAGKCGKSRAGGVLPELIWEGGRLISQSMLQYSLTCGLLLGPHAVQYVSIVFSESAVGMLRSWLVEHVHVSSPAGAPMAHALDGPDQVCCVL